MRSSATPLLLKTFINPETPCVRRNLFSFFLSTICKNSGELVSKREVGSRSIEWTAWLINRETIGANHAVYPPPSSPSPRISYQNGNTVGGIVSSKRGGEVEVRVPGRGKTSRTVVESGSTTGRGAWKVFNQTRHAVSVFFNEEHWKV